MEKETIWRITEADFRGAMESQFSNSTLTDQEKEKIIESARDSFIVPGWEDYVEDFVIFRAKLM